MLQNYFFFFISCKKMIQNKFHDISMNIEYENFCKGTNIKDI